MKRVKRVRRAAAFLWVWIFWMGGPAWRASAAELSLAGVTVTPHVLAANLKWRQPPDPRLGARVQLFVVNTSGREVVLDASLEPRFRGLTPNEWLTNGAWAWHDMPSAWPDASMTLPPDAMTVWTFNGKGTNWGVGTQSDLEVRGGGLPEVQHMAFPIEAPDCWISSLSFLGDPAAAFADRVVVHVANAGARAIRVDGCRLWLPDANLSWRVLKPQPWFTGMNLFPKDGWIAAGDRGGFQAATGRLPLTYAAVEVRLADAEGAVRSLRAHVRIQRQAFDLSGGWVSDRLGGSNTLQFLPYLKTLKRLHVTTGQHGDVPGYTDRPAVFARYPLKLFNRLQPVEKYDNAAVLPRIHGVEFLGEPEYGGGKPIPPMDVWRALAPYQSSRLATTVTHSEERLWRYYAGLSDFPHFDAYRVTAPAADFWPAYDRWHGSAIRWGAPLETIGDMTRSLRELNRPGPIAAWSQGPHVGWESYGGRRRLSPTPDELRSQAFHALSGGIRSLYWFNLSLPALVRYRDLIQPVNDVGRQIRMLEDILLAGDAAAYDRVSRAGGPDWDLSVVAAPEAAACFALDLDYAPDAREKVFSFREPREARFHFRLPRHLRNPVEVVRVEPAGVRDVPFEVTADGIEVADRAACAAIYAASPTPGLRARLTERLSALAAYEAGFDFNPAASDADFDVLKSAVEAR